MVQYGKTAKSHLILSSATIEEISQINIAIKQWCNRKNQLNHNSNETVVQEEIQLNGNFNKTVVP